MRNFILRRLVYAIPTLIGISIITFVIVRMSPGDPIRLFTFGQRDITGEDIARLRHAYGLDKPIPLQYVDWLIAMVQLGERRADAERLLERVKLQQKDLKTTDALLREMLRMRGSGK